MRQVIKPGGKIDAATPDEIRSLLQDIASHSESSRVRAPMVVQLDGNGNGQDEVYSVPMGFEFEVRRVFLDLDTASDPNTGAVILGAQTPVDVDASATGAAAAIVATLPASAVAVATTFITGFEVTGTGATAGSVIIVTVTGILGGTKSYALAIPAGVGNSITPLIVEFSRPIPASGLNQPIAVNVPSFGAGNTNAAVTAHGFQVGIAGGRSVEYLRSGSRMEYAEPTGPNGITQVPGIQTWGSEQGPYLLNGEAFEVKARGLTAAARLTVIVDGILHKRVPARR